MPFMAVCLRKQKLVVAFSVDLSFEGDFSSAMESDQLVHAVDYVLVHAIVREEMAIPSALIEHVAARILKRLKVQFPKRGSLYSSSYEV
jgi:dihydroneopterin aldolase